MQVAFPIQSGFLLPCQRSMLRYEYWLRTPSLSCLSDRLRIHALARVLLIWSPPRTDRVALARDFLAVSAFVRSVQFPVCSFAHCVRTDSGIILDFPRSSKQRTSKRQRSRPKSVRSFAGWGRFINRHMVRSFSTRRSSRPIFRLGLGAWAGSRLRKYQLADTIRSAVSFARR